MLNVYLSGEIHTDWRQEIIDACNKEGLDINFSSPVTNHELSDNCGVEILGQEENNFWKDNKGANINSIRTKKSIEDSDVVIVKFGEKYGVNALGVYLKRRMSCHCTPRSWLRQYGLDPLEDRGVPMA